MPQPHIDLQSAVDATVTSRNAIRAAAEELKAEDNVTPLPPLTPPPALPPLNAA